MSDLSQAPGYDLARRHPAWPAFEEEMRDRDYGPEELDNAWIWFRTGWDRGWSMGNHTATAPMNWGDW